MGVLNWPRDRDDLTDALRRETDAVVVYGSDGTISALAQAGDVIGFGSKVSGAVVLRSMLGEDHRLKPVPLGSRGGSESGTGFSLWSYTRVAEAIARDVTLFEQLGCLSPHHVFVECDDDADAMRFAESLADAMRELALRLPSPSRLELEDAAALRGFRETARWRSIAGEPVHLLEGPNLEWAVVFDRDASFGVTPGLRCVYVSPIRDAEDLGNGSGRCKVESRHSQSRG